MIEVTREAREHIRAFRAHWVAKNWLEPLVRLEAALVAALARIEHDAYAGLLAPRPYPDLAAEGEAWIHEHRYWVAYTLTEPPKVLAVFDETADIPRRYRQQIEERRHAGRRLGKGGAAN